MKILFFGTPAIAVPFLAWLHEHQTVVGVVTKKDEPVGRGYKLTPPPVKIFAQENNLPLTQPTGPWTEEKVKQLKDWNADVGVAVAYGRLMPESIFNAPRLATFNIHFSLLPQYRGAAPMQWSLINGDAESGVTAFWIEKGMDSGPICGQTKVKIEPTDNAHTLKQKLIDEGIPLMAEVIKHLSNGKVIKEDQVGEPTLAPQLKKDHGKIDWSQSARTISNLVRGVVEWPGAFTSYSPQGQSSKILKVLEAVVVEEQSNKGKPGEILDILKNQGILVQSGDGVLLIKKVQPEGKKAMLAEDFWRGAHLSIGDRFGA
ncbi:methionyl-tRNA formyltransferase [bacterium F11]|nr:methionyl-tRNA formyltransferase [bacterium F11]